MSFLALGLGAGGEGFVAIHMADVSWEISWAFNLNKPLEGFISVILNAPKNLHPNFVGSHPSPPCIASPVQALLPLSQMEYGIHGVLTMA